MAEFKVLRRHDGDKEYHEGDVRTAEAADVKHLVDLGVLQPVRAKAEAPLKNKAEPKAENKAAD